MQISEVTGLPELPDDMRWHIGRNQYISYSPNHPLYARVDTPAHFFIAIEKQKEIKTFAQNRKRLWGFLWYIPAAVTIEVSVGWETVTNLNLYHEINEQADEAPKPVSLEELTPDFLRTKAEYLYDNWQARIEAEKMLGTYPPLKLS